MIEDAVSKTRNIFTMRIEDTEEAKEWLKKIDIRNRYAVSSYADGKRTLKVYLKNDEDAVAFRLKFPEI